MRDTCATNESFKSVHGGIEMWPNVISCCRHQNTRLRYFTLLDRLDRANGRGVEWLDLSRPSYPLGIDFAGPLQ